MIRNREPREFSARRLSTSVLVMIFGVLLPAATLAFELATGTCANAYVDPIPTGWHALAVALVPVANGLGLAARHLSGHGLTAARVVNGAALVVAAAYAALFAPILPIVLMLIVGGIGLLPMAPLLSFLSALVLAGRLRRRGLELRRPTSLRPLLLGAACALGVAVLSVAPTILTGKAAEMAVADDAEVAARGRRMLRTYGRRSTLRRMCEGRRQALGRNWFDSGAAREAYYRWTGRPWYADPYPAGLEWRLRREGRWGDWDAGQGSERVGAIRPKLSLHESRLDGRLDGVGSTAYWEWTLAFENADWRQQEARLVLALPPGGVVSRLTLWVDGEEREAAFAGRGETRAAYERIVRRRRDPVLATQLGDDRVLVQCFPVLPRSRPDAEPVQPMRIRVGITAPIVPLDESRARAVLPRLAERNFDLAGTDHELWIESSAEPLDLPASLSAEPAGPEGELAIRGSLADYSLVDQIESMTVSRGRAAEPAVGPPLDGGEAIVQSWRNRPGEPVGRLTVVVDGSASLSDVGSVIYDGLVALPTAIELDVWLAGDRIQRLGREGLTALRDPERFVGGQDSAPALEAALDSLPLADPGALLWIHGAQAVVLDGTDGIVKHFDRRSESPRLLSFATSPYPNELERRSKC
ncbi:MAG: VIT domain-containing protein [Planctomycetota bacterium]